MNHWRLAKQHASNQNSRAARQSAMGRGDERGEPINMGVVLNTSKQKILNKGVVSQQRFILVLKTNEANTPLGIEVMSKRKGSADKKSDYLSFQSPHRYRVQPRHVHAFREIGDDITKREGLLPGTVVKLKGVKMSATAMSQEGCANSTPPKPWPSPLILNLEAHSIVPIDDVVSIDEIEAALRAMGFGESPTHEEDVLAIAASIKLGPDDTAVHEHPVALEKKYYPKLGAAFTLLPQCTADAEMQALMDSGKPFIAGTIGTVLDKDTMFKHVAFETKETCLVIRGNNLDIGHNVDNKKPFCILVTQRLEEGKDEENVQIFTYFWPEALARLAMRSPEEWVTFGPTIARGLCGVVTLNGDKELSELGQDALQEMEVQGAGCVSASLIPDVAKTVHKVGFTFSGKMFQTIVRPNMLGDMQGVSEPYLIQSQKRSDGKFDYAEFLCGSKTAVHLGALDAKKSNVAGFKEAVEKGEAQLVVVVPWKNEEEALKVRAMEDEKLKWAAITDPKNVALWNMVLKAVPRLVYVTTEPGHVPTAVDLIRGQPIQDEEEEEEAVGKVAAAASTSQDAEANKENVPPSSSSAEDAAAAAHAFTPAGVMASPSPFGVNSRLASAKRHQVE